MADKTWIHIHKGDPEKQRGEEFDTELVKALIAGEAVIVPVQKLNNWSYRLQNIVGDLGSDSLEIGKVQEEIEAMTEGK